jgi:hypothetical protein
LAEIDSDPTDEDRLDALKAMFLAANEVNAQDGQRIVAYQLFQIAKQLKSGQLMLLKACYQAFRSGNYQRVNPVMAQQWLQKAASNLHHQLSALVERDEKVLVENGLLSRRVSADSHVLEDNARLTDLGIRFCENLETYQPIAKGSE